MATKIPSRFQLENLTRTVYQFALEVEDADPRNPGRKIARTVGFVALGDKADTDDRVPETGRDDKLQPPPVITLTSEGWERLGPHNQLWIEGEIAAGRIRRTELAA